MHLARERDRRERRHRKPAQAPLDPVEREREQHRDRAEQVPGRLGDAIGSECEREPADERRGEREPERAQPERGQPSGADVGQEDEEVPADDGAEQRLERPEDGRERPAGEVHTRLDLRLEAVRVEPRRLAAHQLVARQPQVVGGLKVVTRRHSPLARCAVAEEAIGLEDGRRGGEQPGAEVEGGR